MMRLFSLSLAFVAATLLFFSACKQEDDQPQEVNLTASDLQITVSENLELGATVGQITANADGEDPRFEFEDGAVTPEDPGASAFTLETTTGKLTVADEAAFDFERRSSISAQVKVTAGTEELVVNILVQLEDQKAPAAMIDQLTQTWDTDKFSFDGVFSAMDIHDCRLDDQMEIKADGTYTYMGGEKLCGNEDNQSIKSGTWDLDENLKFVLFDKGEDNEFEATIDFFEEGRILLSGSYFGIPVSGEYLAL